MPRGMISDKMSKRLIQEVKQRECLWNPEHDRYNDRYQMSKSWWEIAKIMELPEERLRVKWKNLRDLFKKEVKKFGPIDKYTGRWRHFEELKFLDGISDKKGKKISLNNVQSIVETKIEIKEDEEINDDEEIEFEIEEENDLEENNEVYLHEAFEEDPLPSPEKRAKTNIDEDYDVMFLKSLAPYFKELDPIRKLVVRSKMQDMLLNEIAAQSANQMKKS